MFAIGDKVVYPMHGAGVIVAMEHRDFLGEEVEYLIMSIPIGQLQISIPRCKAQEIGIRSVSSESETARVMQLLRADMEEMPANWNQRNRENLEKLKTGDIFEVADVVRNLTLLHREKGLSTGEKKMLTNARNILISEIIVVDDACQEEVEQLIDQAIGQT